MFRLHALFPVSSLVERPVECEGLVYTRLPEQRKQWWVQIKADDNWPPEFRNVLNSWVTISFSRTTPHHVDWLVLKYSNVINHVVLFLDACSLCSEYRHVASFSPNQVQHQFSFVTNLSFIPQSSKKRRARKSMLMTSSGFRRLYIFASMSPFWFRVTTSPASLLTDHKPIYITFVPPTIYRGFGVGTNIIRIPSSAKHSTVLNCPPNLNE
jgi:hypothetical protein